MDQAKLDQSLQDFADSLPETPVYIILMRQSGEIMSRWGELAGNLSSTDIARMTSALGLQERETLDSLKHGNLQYAIHAGGAGVYFIINLIDTYLVGYKLSRCNFLQCNS